MYWTVQGVVHSCFIDKVTGNPIAPQALLPQKDRVWDPAKQVDTKVSAYCQRAAPSMDDAKAIQQQWVEAWRSAQVPEDKLVEGSLGGLELLLSVYNFFFPGTVSSGALYDDTKLA